MMPRTSGTRGGRHFLPVAYKVCLAAVTIFMVMLSVAPASAAESPVTYVIDAEGIRSQFSTGIYEGYVTVGNTSQIILEDPLLVMALASTATRGTASSARWSTITSGPSTS